MLTIFLSKHHSNHSFCIGNGKKNDMPILLSENGQNGHYLYLVPPLNNVYSLLHQQITATHVKAPINSHVRNMAT